MGENNSDDPFAPRDGTIVRPRPGAGRRTAPETPLAGQPPVPPPRPRAAVAVSQTASGNAALSDFLGTSLNPILQTAAPLMTLAAQLQSTVQQANVATLRQQAVHEIRTLDDRLRSLGVASEDILVARYVLCTFVDSAVLNTPWGAQSDWAGQSLLAMFHKEVSGGEKFFQILDRVSGNPTRYIDLIELLYVCLTLGYEGKYRLDADGHARLAELQHGLYRHIREQRQIRDQPLSPHWKGLQDRRNPIIQYVPWWIVGAAGAALLVIAFVVYQVLLSSQAKPIKAVLAGTAAPVEYTAPAPPPRANRLKQLLAPEEAAGRVTIEEFGDKTLVTVTAADLFRSGSARINPSTYSTVRAVAAALNQVPGRVIVIGHTDDQAVRSFQFADNFELSRERARAVAGLLKPDMTEASRVEFSGVGATQPRYRPVDTAENRARNRRVEIVHVAPAEHAP